MEEQEKNYREFFDFLSEFTIKYREEECKLKYNVNLIDILGADENAHSRILEKLLKIKNFDSQRFEVLESFIQYVQKKAIAFGGIKIEKPEITQETERIDLWVRDENYAIIIENKIHHADDKEEQLSRYIEKTKRHNYENEQIYIVYLNDYEPDEQSWGEYKEKYKNRYVRLSFNEDILSWLKEEILPWVNDKVLPDTRLNGKCLLSALEQYIDHLEGMFELRKINNKMNMDLQEFIKKEWGLNDNLIENYKKLSEKKKEIEKLTTQIDNLINQKIDALLEQWEKFLKNKGFEHVHKDGEHVRVSIPIEKQNFDVSLGVEGRDIQKTYCQVYPTDDGTTPRSEIMEKLEEILSKKMGNNPLRYEYLGSNTFKDLSEEGCILIDKVIKCLMEFK